MSPLLWCMHHRKQGSWEGDRWLQTGYAALCLKDQMEYSSVSNLVHSADFKLQTSITPELYNTNSLYQWIAKAGQRRPIYSRNLDFKNCNLSVKSRSILFLWSCTNHVCHCFKAMSLFRILLQHGLFHETSASVLFSLVPRFLNW